MSDSTQEPKRRCMPSRIRWYSPLLFVVYVLLIAGFYMSLKDVEFDLERLETGLPGSWEYLWEISPIDWELIEEPYQVAGFEFQLYEPIYALTEREEERIEPLMEAMLLTIQIAFVGGSIGIVISFVLSFLIARNLTPHPILAYILQSIVTLCRSVPDLVWALFFVIAVGLGPIAGVFAIMMDTIGFCGRYFAHDLENVDRGPQEALRSLGAGRIGTFCAATVPAALPSMLNNSMFAYEKAIRSSMILGIVGAGGIGIELKAAMDMFEYRFFGLIVIFIFVVVLGFETATNILTAMVRGDRLWFQRLGGWVIGLIFGNQKEKRVIEAAV